jgi:hypothetical protein
LFIIYVYIGLGISTPASTQGVVGTFIGSATSNLTIHNAQFVANGSNSGIIGGSSTQTLGGVVYVGSVYILDVNGSSFQSVSQVGKGGGLYVNSSSFGVDIKGSSFSLIIVTSSGGIVKREHFYVFLYILIKNVFCFLLHLFRWCFLWPRSFIRYFQQLIFELFSQ